MMIHTRILQINLYIALFLSSAYLLINLNSWHSFFFAIPFLTIAYLQIWLLAHEATHGALSENRFINNLLGLIYSGMTLYPFFFIEKITYRTPHIL